MSVDYIIMVNKHRVVTYKLSIMFEKMYITYVGTLKSYILFYNSRILKTFENREL